MANAWAGYVEQIGLSAALAAAGFPLHIHDGVVYVDDLAGAQAFASSFDQVANAKTLRLAELSAIRWRKETGGTVVNNVTIATDDRSKIMIEGARSAAEANANYTVNWKVAAGQFTPLTAAQIISISDAVRAHIQGCFNTEQSLSASIAAATTVAAVYAVDLTVGWPA